MKRLLRLIIITLLFSAGSARAQNYTDAYLNSVNYNSVYPCGNQGTPTVQMQQALLSVANHGGGTVDMTCYQTAITLTSDVFSGVTKHIVLILPPHVVTVQANATVPINFTLIYSNGSALSAGPAFWITDNSLPYRSPNGFQQLDHGIATAPTLTPGGAGTLALGAKYYVVTSVLSTGGETQGSPEAHVTLTAGQTSVALAWTADTNAASYNIYRGTSSGGESLYYSSATNSFTDTGAAGTAGDRPQSTAPGFR